MYGFPADLDLSDALGQAVTQFCIGPYDLQLAFGDVVFGIQSKVELMRNGVVVGIWEQGRWPDPTFYEIFGNPVTAIVLLDSKRLSIRIGEDLELQLQDASDQYESMWINIGHVNHYI